MSTTKTQASWRDEIRLVKVRSMRGGPHSESDPFVATVEVRDEKGVWHKLNVSDDGRGGMYRTSFEEMGRDTPMNSWQLQAELQKRVVALQNEQVGKNRYDMLDSWDCIVGALVEEAEEQKIIAKKVKTCVVFRDGKKLAWVNVLPTAANIAKYRAKYPNAEILNKDVASDADADAAKHARTQKWVWSQIAKGNLVIQRTDGEYRAYRGTTLDVRVAAFRQHPGCTIVNPGVSKEAR
jgi:hypothetical protein